MRFAKIGGKNLKKAGKRITYFHLLIRHGMRQKKQMIDSQYKIESSKHPQRHTPRHRNIAIFMFQKSSTHHQQSLPRNHRNTIKSTTNTHIKRLFMLIE